LLVEVHVQRLEFVAGDIAREFLLEDLRVFLGDLDPEFVVFLDPPSDGGAVDGD